MRERCTKFLLNRWGAALVLVPLFILAPGMARAVIAPELEKEGWREIPNPNKKENVFGLTPEARSR